MAMNASNLRLNPFQYGEAMAKRGGNYYSPYQNRERTAEFKRGYDAQLARTAGQPQHKEQPLP